MDEHGFNGPTFNIGLMIPGKNKISFSTIGRNRSIKLRFSNEFIVIFFSIVKFLKFKIKQLYF